MSAGDRARTVRRDPASAGFTVLEMVATLAILSLMALVIERTMASTTSATRQIDASRRATERSERIAYEILDDVSRSRKLLAADGIGEDYLAAADLSRHAILPSARLPVFEEVRGLDVDLPGDPRTGNILLFARESDPAMSVADPATGRVRFIDMYRFICVYPHVTSRYVVAQEARQPAVDLIVWRSLLYANHTQIAEIKSASERDKVVADLVNRFKIEYAWDPAAPVNSAFYAMSGTGAISATPTAGFMIEEDLDLSDGGRIVYANCQLAPTAADFHRRAVFAVDDPATWSPGGFEVKIFGASGARKVWLHLVVETQAAKGIVGVHASTLLSSSKDM